MNNIVVKIEKSGNRFNAFDSDGNKYTSDISTSTRKKAYLSGMALERRTGKNGRTYQLMTLQTILRFLILFTIHIN